MRLVAAKRRQHYGYTRLRAQIRTALARASSHSNGFSSGSSAGHARRHEHRTVLTGRPFEASGGRELDQQFGMPLLAGVSEGRSLWLRHSGRRCAGGWTDDLTNSSRESRISTFGSTPFTMRWKRAGCRYLVLPKGRVGRRLGQARNRRKRHVTKTKSRIVVF
jgi:hypothetical protein